MTRILYKIKDQWTEIDVDEVCILGEQLSSLYKQGMHPKQKAILELSDTRDLSKMTLREIGAATGMGVKPQVVKHHLEQLYKKGLLSHQSKE